jgi:hypothetical protein
MRGYVASLTLKNYPGVDIFALNPSTDRQVAVQVKAIRIKGGVKVGDTASTPYAYGAYFIPESVDDHPNRPFVFVVIKGDTDVDYFVIPGAIVAEISKREWAGILRLGKGEGSGGRGAATADAEPEGATALQGQTGQSAT